MKELFESLWEVAPRLMSVVVILGALYFVAYEVVSLQHRLENMDKRLTRVEERLDSLEKKVDIIIEYILRERTEHQHSEKSTGR
jgi:tetrahydromethanopterin S-methyltransferase subunit G